MPIRNPVDPRAPPGQLTLPGFDATSRPFAVERSLRPGVVALGYSLFLAIHPPRCERLRIAGLVADLCRRHGFTGPRIAAECLHVTLHKLGGFGAEVAQAVIDAVVVASSRVVCPSLAVAFDHVMSFAGSGAFVLGCDDATGLAVARLRQSLATAVRSVGLRAEPSPTPHMTLLYDQGRFVPACEIEQVAWNAEGFSLIISHVGLGYHQRIAAWACG